jgi:hypothetical protein
MDYGKALTFIFDDARWVTKAAIGVGLLIAGTVVMFAIIAVGIFAMIPLAAMTDEYGAGPAIGIGFATLITCLSLLAVAAYFVGFVIVQGYAIRLLQNVRDGLAAPLPEWDQWSQDLVRGAKSVVVNIVWGLPFLIVFIPFFCIIPFMVISAANAANSGDEGVMAVFGIQAAVWCTIPVILLVQVLYQLFAPGFTIAYARREQIGEGLRFGAIYRWTRANLSQVAIVALVAFGVAYAINTIAAMVGMLLCFVGLLVTAPLGTLFASLYTHHLYGQLAAAHPQAGMSVSPTALPEPPAPSMTPAEADAGVAVTPPAAPPVEDEPPAA